MSITKETIIDKIEIVGEYKKLSIREAVVIKENETEIARNLHRRVIAPSGSNSSISASLATENSEIRDIANLVWTDTIKTNYNNFLTGSQTP
tara:strand:+ start:127 stop:402 length:276 start_codon:yes stop_codon:yes gene_type:complete